MDPDRTPWWVPGIIMIAVVIGGILFIINDPTKTEWKDIGVVNHIILESDWHLTFTITTRNHGIIHSHDGPDGNMTAPFFFGCSGYSVGFHINDTLGIIYRRSCGYEMTRLYPP